MIGGGEIGERAGRGRSTGSAASSSGGACGSSCERLHRLALQMQEARLDLGRARFRLGDAQHARHQERPALEELDDLEALLALADEVVACRPAR